MTNYDVIPLQHEMRANAPMWWYNKSSNLRGAAAVLHGAVGACNYDDIAKNLNVDPDTIEFGFTEPVYMMLCGMSLETIYKGVLVAKRKRPPESHDLIDLASRAGIAVSDRQKKALKLFEYALVWHGRYPAPKSKRSIDYYDYLDLRHEIGGNGNLKKISDRIEAELGWHAFDRLWSPATKMFFTEYDKHPC